MLKEKTVLTFSLQNTDKMKYDLARFGAKFMLDIIQ